LEGIGAETAELPRLDSDVPGIGLVADAEMGLFWWSRVPRTGHGKPGHAFFWTSESGTLAYWHRTPWLVATSHGVDLM